MISNILFTLTLLGVYHSLPDKYFMSIKTTLKPTNNSRTPQELKHSKLEKFVRSFPIPSEIYNSNQWKKIENKNSESSKHLFLNQQPVISVQPLPAPIFALNEPNPVLPLVRPFSIQQPTISVDGQVIIENLLGGVPFNCWGRPSGHYRDSNFCDVFHACVHGYQRKTYSCPFVGESQYFNELTQRCEFVRNNPFGCASKIFYH